MASSAWATYNTSRKYMLDGTIDFDTNSFSMALFTSASNCNDATIAPIYATLTNEVANANGYTTGGVALSTPTVTVSTVTTTYSIGNGVFTASGGSITCRYAVIYVNATVNTIVKPLVCYTLLDTTPADVVINNGATLTIQINVAGVFTLTGM
jgi:hypothetical protein